MNLEEFETIYEASKPYFDNPTKRDMRTLSEKYAFERSCREMVPKLIDAARASWHLVRALDDGQAIVSGSALHKLLRVTLLDVERTQVERE